MKTQLANQHFILSPSLSLSFSVSHSLSLSLYLKEDFAGEEVSAKSKTQEAATPQSSTWMHFISLLLPWAVLACTHCIIYFPNWKQFFSDPRTTCWYRKHILIPIFSWSGLQWSFVKLHTCNRPVSAAVLSMTVGPKLRFFFFFFLRKWLLGVVIKFNFERIYSSNGVTKFIREVDQNCYQCCSVALVYCTKLRRKLAISQTMFFIPSRELISRTDGWKAPKLGSIAHCNILFQNGAGDFWYLVSCPFFFCLFSKNCSILYTNF